MQTYIYIEANVNITPFIHIFTIKTREKNLVRSVADMPLFSHIRKLWCHMRHRIPQLVLSGMTCLTYK